jgi:hypothetical protein
MNLGGFLDAKAQQPLPPVFEDHEPELYAFQKYCQTMINKILDLFAVGLEVHLIPLPLSSKTATPHTNTTRSPPQPKAQNTSPTAMAPNQPPAPCASSTTHPSPQTSKSNPKLTSVREHTQITAPSPSYFKDLDNQDWKSCLHPHPPRRQNGRPSPSSLQERNPTLHRRFSSILAICYLTGRTTFSSQRSTESCFLQAGRKQRRIATALRTSDIRLARRF